MFDKITYNLLKQLYRRGEMTEQEVNNITYQPDSGSRNRHISFLMENHLIEEKRTGEKMDSKYNTEEEGIAAYSINLKGRAYIEQKRRDFLGFLIPYAITTFIALLSLAGVIAENWATIVSWFR